MKVTISDKLFSFFCHAAVLMFSLVCLYPLILTLMVSFSDENRVQLHGFKLIPEKFSINTYHYLWMNAHDKITSAYIVTIIVTVFGTLIAMIITSMLAYTISQRKIKYRNIISLFCYFTVIFSAGVIPWYIVCVNILHINNTIWGLILPYSVNVWNLFLLKNYFQSIPIEIIESGEVEGANFFHIFYKLIIPMSRTSVLTVAMFYAIQYWNDWWLGIMLISNNKLYPLQYYLYNILTSAQALSSGQAGGISAGHIAIPSETIKMAITMITIAPLIFVFPFIQRYFIKGLMVGAVKG